mmetsp:Transcript_2472/g.5555  ORF Transcript_2472/g.5555 Transcript_2472/m.5555 type:complete len:247 (-) Transcript_2472:723-1463(-)
MVAQPHRRAKRIATTSSFSSGRTWTPLTRRRAAAASTSPHASTRRSPRSTRRPSFLLSSHLSGHSSKGCVSRACSASYQAERPSCSACSASCPCARSLHCSPAVMLAPPRSRRCRCYLRGLLEVSPSCSASPLRPRLSKQRRALSRRCAPRCRRVAFTHSTLPLLHARATDGPHAREVSPAMRRPKSCCWCTCRPRRWRPPEKSCARRRRRSLARRQPSRLRIACTRRACSSSCWGTKNAKPQSSK